MCVGRVVRLASCAFGERVRCLAIPADIGAVQAEPRQEVECDEGDESARGRGEAEGGEGGEWDGGEAEKSEGL